MDFVVVGFGLGALVVLVGFAVRDIGPRLGAASTSQDQHHDDLPEWAKAGPPAVDGHAEAIRRSGVALAVAGAIICVATVGALVARLDDDTGSIVVLGTAFVALGSAAAAIVALLRPYPRVAARERADRGASHRLGRLRHPIDARVLDPRLPLPGWDEPAVADDDVEQAVPERAREPAVVSDAPADRVRQVALPEPVPADGRDSSPLPVKPLFRRGEPLAALHAGEGSDSAPASPDRRPAAEAPAAGPIADEGTPAETAAEEAAPAGGGERTLAPSG